MEKCVTCHFYDRRHSRGLDGRSSRIGQCRRAAPMLSPVTTKSYQIEGVWPTVRDDDWCGEWKILPRRPAAAPAPPLAIANGATVTTLVAVASNGSRDSCDDILLPEAPGMSADRALAMAAD